MRDEEIEYINNLEQAYKEEKLRNISMSQSQSSMFSSADYGNLIEWQLSLKEDLEKIEHILRGHRFVRDADGGEKWEEPDSDDEKPFNEKGVQMLLKALLFYMNKNTLLSNYDEETINWKVFDFANKIIDLIHNCYQEMGMDTDEKRKLYPLIVQSMVDTVHSAYLRALNGGERDSLRTARTVNQTEPLMKQSYGDSMSSRKKFSFIKPSTWF